MKKHSSLIYTLSLSFLLGCFSPAVPLAGNETLFPSAHAAEGTKWNPGHYLRIHPGSHDHHLNNHIDTPEFTGFVVRFAWSKLEPSKNQYDFSAIEQMLDRLEQHDKRLIVSISDRIFWKDCTVAPIPKYLREDPIYQGGDFKRTSGACAAKLWVPSVMERKIALLQAIAKRFNKEPFFEGIRAGESSLTTPGDGAMPDGSGGYKTASFKEQLSKYIKSVQPAFANTIVIMDMNFLGSGTDPADLDDLADVQLSVEGAGGIGLPDTVPCRSPDIPESERCRDVIPGYLTMQKYRGKVAMTPSAETPQILFDETDDIYQMLVDTLGADHIVWDPVFTGRKEGFVPKYIEEQILPTIRKNNGRINTTCPASLAPCITGSNDIPVNNPPTTSACHQLTATSNTSLPPGYAAPWDFFSQAKQTFFKTYCDTTNRLLTLEVGTGTQFEYTYNKGYFLKNNQWQPYTLQCSGSGNVGDWCKGKATATLDFDPSTPDYLLAYHCRLLNNQWKCGCQDQTCTTPTWNLQMAKTGE